ncbi:MAG: hypothetical protein A3F11_11165 [Gammaproteobacteria bacterium RIFCSPHIGHO2_12_FULL_37_14]|nr:MAG: hypothetical protein A3F11_11165 [Gammaproteobacteria bacterium RIFCSPHIGHO2_12_FULL_37_14]
MKKHFIFMMLVSISSILLAGEAEEIESKVLYTFSTVRNKTGLLHLLHRNLDSWALGGAILFSGTEVENYIEDIKEQPTILYDPNKKLAYIEIRGIRRYPGASGHKGAIIYVKYDPVHDIIDNLAYDMAVLPGRSVKEKFDNLKHSPDIKYLTGAPLSRSTGQPAQQSFAGVSGEQPERFIDASQILCLLKNRGAQGSASSSSGIQLPQRPREQLPSRRKRTQ